MREGLEESASQGDGSTPYTPTQLDWLVMLCNAQAASDGVRHEQVKLNFNALPPNTVEIVVGYSQDADFEKTKYIAELGTTAVKAWSKKMGWESWARVTCRFYKIEPWKPE
jgi:hypothetical protein